MQSGAGEAAQVTSASSAVSYIYRQEGVGGFYRGCMANNVRAIASAVSVLLLLLLIACLVGVVAPHFINASFAAFATLSISMQQTSHPSARARPL